MENYISENHCFYKPKHIHHAGACNIAETENLLKMRGVLFRFFYAKIQSTKHHCKLTYFAGRHITIIRRMCIIKTLIFCLSIKNR